MPRETGRRRRNADDDESSSEDEQQTTTTTMTTAQEPPAVAPPAAAPVPPTRVRAKAPAAAAVKPPVLPSHADPTSAAAAAAVPSAVTAPAPVAPKKSENSSDDGDDSSSSDDDSDAGVAAPTSTSSVHSALAQQLETMNYDTLTYAALLSLMKQASRPVIEELMAQLEQQVESTNQQLQNYRVERFLDAGTSADAAGNAAAASNANEEDSTEGYRYNAMLTRLFEALNRNNEGSAMTERNQLPVPILERMGKKKTVIVNFGRICEVFHRSMDDVKDFIEKELSIRGNVDSNDALILKYEIRKQTDFDRVLIKYLDEYVKCNSCHRIDTTLTKDGRRLELRCNVCTATRTVTAASTATFSAQIEKRSRQRAAMTL